MLDRATSSDSSCELEIRLVDFSVDLESTSSDRYGRGENSTETGGELLKVGSGGGRSRGLMSESISFKPERSRYQ